MPIPLEPDRRPHRRRLRQPAVLAVALVLTVTACTSGAAKVTSASPPQGSSTSSAARSTQPVSTQPVSTPARPSVGSTDSRPTANASRPADEFTFAVAGDVNFAERTATRLAANPATAFGVAAAAIGGADLSMVNLETSVSVGGTPQPKSFTFQAPPSALTALKDAGIDLATMANNHGADYGAGGLQQTLAAIRAAQFPVIGIGANAAAAYAPYYTQVRGNKVAVIAASQVKEETLANFSAGPNSAGIANAFSAQLVTAVRTARARGYTVVVYLHWGTEYVSCPNSDQTTIANTLAAAGAAAVVGTHAHVLLGAGWRPDGTYVAYGLSNYLWWRSFGNEQDDNGVLTLTFRAGKVIGASFAAAHLDDTGVPVPATGATKLRIDAEWERDRTCTGLAATAPG